MLSSSSENACASGDMAWEEGRRGFTDETAMPAEVGESQTFSRRRIKKSGGKDVTDQPIEGPSSSSFSLSVTARCCRSPTEGDDDGVTEGGEHEKRHSATIKVLFMTERYTPLSSRFKSASVP